ncbi:MAG: extracellular solute-binding protein [Elusimicrobiota bacterium]
MRRLGLLAALLFAACGRGAQDGTVLRLSGWSSSPEEAKLIETQIAEFESLHPGLRVKFEPIVGDYMQKLQVLFASRTEPDVFYLDSKDIDRMAYYGVLEPLDAHLAAAGDDGEDFYANLLACFRGPDGRLYGLPKGFSTLALYYNKDLLAQAGVQEPPRDWAALLRAAAALRARGRTPLSLTADMKTIHLFTGLSGGAVLKDLKTLAFLEPPARAGIATLLSLFTGARPLARLPQDFGKSWTGDAFAVGDAAMIIEGMWVAPYLRLRAPELRYGFAPVPPITRRYNLFFTVAYVASARSRHKPEAVALLRYLTGRRGLAHVAELGLEIPSRRSVAETDFLKRFPERAPFIDAVAYSVPFKYGIDSNRLVEHLGKAVDAARLGQMSDDEALARAARQLKRFYRTP